nr:MAG TPA: hypothetical protein [Caudoviricetes sp.]
MHYQNKTNSKLLKTTNYGKVHNHLQMRTH